MTTIPLGPALLTGSSGLPGGFGRAVLERLPIWPCSVRGFACHRPRSRRGALLPHLFTLTSPKLAAQSRERRRAVYFLCHCPSGCPDRALPGALPYGVRTFLGAGHACARLTTRSSRRLRRNFLLYRLWTEPRNSGTWEPRNRYPSISCLMLYCSSFLYRLLRGVSMTSAVFEMF